MHFEQCVARVIDILDELKTQDRNRNLPKSIHCKEGVEALQALLDTVESRHWDHGTNDYRTASEFVAPARDHTQKDRLLAPLGGAPNLAMVI
jgi:hypothetical protein